MTNIVQQYINEFVKLIDKSYREGWLWYILGVLILIIILVVFFA